MVVQVDNPSQFFEALGFVNAQTLCVCQASWVFAHAKLVKTVIELIQRTIDQSKKWILQNEDVFEWFVVCLRIEKHFGRAQKYEKSAMMFTFLMRWTTILFCTIVSVTLLLPFIWTLFNYFTKNGEMHERDWKYTWDCTCVASSTQAFGINIKLNSF